MLVVSPRGSSLGCSRTVLARKMLNAHVPLSIANTLPHFSLNVLLPSTMISGVLILGLWLPARGAVPITMFSASYGLFSGESV
jgi:hypothetical protein